MFSHITAKTLPCSKVTRILQLFADGILTAPWCKKISEFHSGPFRGREKCSEFHTVIQKQKQTFKILFRSISRNRKENSSEFRSAEQKQKQTFETLFRSISQKRKQLRIPSSRPKNRRKLSEFCSQALHRRKNALNSVC